MEKAAVQFMYDGTFEGFMCCVYELYYSNYRPVSVVSFDEWQPTFLDNVEIPTDAAKAERVRNALLNKAGPMCMEVLKRCHMSDLVCREMAMLKYVVKAFSKGTDIVNDLSDPDVVTVHRRRKRTSGERERFVGLVRFSKSGDIYYSRIDPACRILPLLAHHFAERFGKMNFIIFDEKNREALVGSGGKTQIIPAKSIDFPAAGSDEIRIRKLWKLYYDTIAISHRTNHALRRNNMPKRTWKNLTEMQETGLPEK